ncbi:MAG TPA: hypothetical protein VG097_03400, partial [Gemmata sp.]|nr:hypothetical protein [Gemmata sp.]
MPAPITPKVDEDPRDDQDPTDESSEEETPEKIEGPPEEDFDDKYNKRLEFPISLVAAILFHVVVGAVLIFVLVGLLGDGDDKSGVPVKLVALDGFDDSGEGSAGSGGVEDPFIKADGDPDKALDSLVDPSKLPDVKENIQKTIKYIDPTGNLQISDANAAAYSSLNESVRKKLLGQRQGAGNEKGSGFDGSKGTGPGGTGADSTLGRNMRWVLRFKVESGRNYLEQLKVMQAELLVPYPNSERCVLIENLDNTSNQRTATDDDMRRLSNKVKFSDGRREAVRAIAQTLGLDFTPQSFWAFFPKKIENELAQKETNYRNRRAE